jgi:hypothetical protein
MSTITELSLPLKGIITQHDTIKWEVGPLRQLVEKMTSNNVHTGNHQREVAGFGVGDNTTVLG